MSRENVELVLAAFDEVQRGDLAAFDRWSDDLVWDVRSGFDLPGMSKVYRGREGLVEFWVGWMSVWESIEFTSLEAEDLGDHVLVEVHQRNRGRVSGVELELHYFQTFTVRDGLLVASRSALTRDEAIAALGAV